MIHTGVDIVSIERIDSIYKKYGFKFLRRFFSDYEIDYLRLKSNNIQSIAGIFSAKEAVSKALGTGIGKLSWKDIEIQHDDNGKPQVFIKDDVLDKLHVIERNFSISISHEKNYAVSFVIRY